MRKTPWILVTLIGLAGLGALLIPREVGGQPAPPSLAGTVFAKEPAAPDIRLTDQFGHQVELSRLRGRTVVLTFLESHCTQLCPLVAEKMRRLLAGLGPDARLVTVLAISTDPEGDTPASVRSFSRKHGMLHRWHYLAGSRARLAPVWRSYYIYAAPRGASASLDAAHTSATYLIDSRGRERVLMGGDPDASSLDRDVRLLAGLPAGLDFARSAPAPEVGHPAPNFALRTPAGSTVRLSSLRGKVVLLNFWATWCTACRSEMPRLAGWYRQLRAREFVVLGVDQQESSGVAAQYARRLHIPYPIVVDGGTISADYDVVGLPTSLLIGRHGAVAAVKLGTLDSSFLKDAIRPLVGGSYGG